MNDLIKLIPDMDNTGLLIVCAILGTLFAYIQKWAWSDNKTVGIKAYLFGDGRAIARVFTKLVGALAVAITVDMQANMDMTAIVALGIGIGLAVPEKVEQQLSNIEKENDDRSEDGRSDLQS